MFYYAEETRELVNSNGFGVDHESGVEVICYVVYRDGVELECYQYEDDAAEACDYGNDVQRQAHDYHVSAMEELASLRKEG